MMIGEMEKLIAACLPWLCPWLLPTRVHTVSRKASTRRSVLRALIFDDDVDDECGAISEKKLAQPQDPLDLAPDPVSSLRVVLHLRFRFLHY